MWLKPIFRLIGVTRVSHYIGLRSKKSPSSWLNGAELSATAVDITGNWDFNLKIRSQKAVWGRRLSWVIDLVIDSGSWDPEGQYRFELTANYTKLWLFQWSLSIFYPHRPFWQHFIISSRLLSSLGSICVALRHSVCPLHSILILFSALFTL